jgi:hypothetical protein
MGRDFQGIDCPQYPPACGASEDLSGDLILRLEDVGASARESTS